MTWSITDKQLNQRRRHVNTEDNNNIVRTLRNKRPRHTVSLRLRNSLIVTFFDLVLEEITHLETVNLRWNLSIFCLFCSDYTCKHSNNDDVVVDVCKWFSGMFNQACSSYRCLIRHVQSYQIWGQNIIDHLSKVDKESFWKSFPFLFFLTFFCFSIPFSFLSFKQVKEKKNSQTPTFLFPFLFCSFFFLLILLGKGESLTG